MKFFYVHILFAILLLPACSRQVETITRDITVDFDNSVADSSFVRFLIDKDSLVTVHFSKGLQENGKYTLTHAMNVKEPGPVIIKISSAASGEHGFSLSLDSCSPWLEPEFGAQQMIGIKIFAGKTIFNWRLIALGIVTLLLGGFIIWRRKIYRSNRSFDTGYLDIQYPEYSQHPEKKLIFLYKKRKIGLDKQYAGEDYSCTLRCVLLYTQKDGKEVRVKQAQLEAGSPLSIVINNVLIDSQVVTLEDNDMVVVKNNDTDLLRFQYYQI